MKNRIVELERFIACCIIFFYHCGGHFGSGWIVVEFFFLLTGYFATQHYETHKLEAREDMGWYPIRYTFKKFLTLIPYTAAGTLLVWGWKIYSEGIGGRNLLKWILCLPADLSLTAGAGLPGMGQAITDGFYTTRMIDVHLWYINCMLFVLPVFMYLLYQEKLRGILCTIVPTLLYGLLIMADGTVNGWHHAKYGILQCDMRALAGLLLGAGAWHFSRFLKSRQWTKLQRVLFTVVELGIGLLAVGIAEFATIHYDALVILLFFLLVSITTSAVSYTSRLNFRVFEWLGKLALPVYCLQMGFLLILDGKFTKHSALITFAVTIAASVMLQGVIYMFRKKLHKI